MNKVLITGLLTSLAAVLANYFQINHFPTSTVAWEILGITLIGNLLVYLAKNAIAPSTSTFLNVNVGDLISGLVLVLGSALVSFGAAALTATAIDWILLWHTALSVGGAYLATKFGFGPPAPATTK